MHYLVVYKSRWEKGYNAEEVQATNQEEAVKKLDAQDVDDLTVYPIWDDENGNMMCWDAQDLDL